LRDNYQSGLLRDAIADFVVNGSLPGDQIDLSTIDANSTTGGNQAFTFIFIVIRSHRVGMRKSGNTIAIQAMMAPKEKRCRKI